jgi:hypothetical protein
VKLKFVWGFRWEPASTLVLLHVWLRLERIKIRYYIFYLYRPYNIRWKYMDSHAVEAVTARFVMSAKHHTLTLYGLSNEVYISPLWWNHGQVHTSPRYRCRYKCDAPHGSRMSSGRWRKTSTWSHRCKAHRAVGPPMVLFTVIRHSPGSGSRLIWGSRQLTVWRLLTLDHPYSKRQAPLPCVMCDATRRQRRPRDHTSSPSN